MPSGRLGRLGAFDFNSRFYADDDLIVGAADPYQLFRIMNEIVDAGALAPDSGVNFMLDQCHNLEEKIPGEIRSATNVQEATAKALLVDREALSAARAVGDVLAANDVFVDAFNTDVRPLLVELRAAGSQMAGHLVVNYLKDLAGAWHQYYDAGHKVLHDDPAVRDARLLLTHAVRHVLRNGLDIIGAAANARV